MAINAELAEARRLLLAELIATKFDNSEAAFAKAIGRSASYVNRMLNKPDPNVAFKRMGEDVAAYIETTLDLAPGYFLSPLGVVSRRGASGDHLHTAFSDSGRSPDELTKPRVGGPQDPPKLTETVPQRRRGVPVRGTAVTGENDVVDVSPLEAEPIGWVGALTSEGAYALRIKGDHFWPVIKAGAFIVVEPALEPTNGQKVLITLKSGQQVVKELQYATGDTVSVTSIKTGVPQTLDASDIELVHSIGSVVEAARFERA